MSQRSTGLSVSKARRGSCNIRAPKGWRRSRLPDMSAISNNGSKTRTDADIGKILSQQVLAFLSYLRTDYVPHRIAADNSHKLALKTVYNLCISS